MRRELTQKKQKKTITLDDNALAQTLFGHNGENLGKVEAKLGVVINSRGNVVTIDGPSDAVLLAIRILRELYAVIKKGHTLYAQDFDHAIGVIMNDEGASLEELFGDTIYVSHKHRAIAPKSAGQKRYTQSIRDNDIVFAIGPAGTGKTYLAMAAAVAAYANKDVDRIILVRPAVEAGEKLGFLPGDLVAKVDPYLRPLYDALNDMMDFERCRKLMDKGIIEVAPLAFMRGRTLNDSFVILDEAQNSTTEQMKMFLTRLGFGSKAVVTGDITQIDLPLAKPSGLVEAQDILKGIDGIDFVYFTEADVVRHPLVQQVIKAFEKVERKRGSHIVVEEEME